MTRVELNLGQVVGKILDIESSIGVRCLSYGLYDKTNKEYITEHNKSTSFDYSDAYQNRCKFRYTYDEALTEDVIIYLLKHHGEIYFPMLKRGTCKAYVAQFDMTELLAKYGQNCSVTPDRYFTEQFCWGIPKKKSSKQCEGQMVLQLN